QRAGDEQAQRIFRAHHQLLRRTVAAHGGAEVKWLGDGLMSAFASAADAGRCAVALQPEGRGRGAGGGLGVRGGLHVRAPLREGGDSVGTPVVVAGRLCDQARAGEILCSAVVAALLASQRAFHFQDRGALTLRGVTEPVAACAVEYQAEQRAALLTRSPFV